jgi:hypothetical protein
VSIITMAHANVDNPPLSVVMARHTRHQTRLKGSMRSIADTVALAYIGFIATVASVTGAYYVMFPELGALSWDVMEQPRGRWATSPWMLALTPPLTGLIGSIVTRSMPYGMISVLITVTSGVATVTLLRSPVAPAISAGLLPLVLGVTSWWYPPGILFGSALLAAISIPWRRYAVAEGFNSAGENESSSPKPETPAIEISTAPESRLARILPPQFGPLIAFVAIAMITVKLTGMRFILFPPLVVILYEMLCHRERCPWIARPVALPIACFFAAAGGYFLHAHIMLAPLAAILSMTWGIAVLRTLDLHVPPALAVALLPMVMNAPTPAYPIAVGIGTTLASVWFTLLVKLGR